MANAFKQKQEKAKRDNLQAECKALAECGAAGRRRAIETYVKQAGVSKEQAERALGLR